MKGLAKLLFLLLLIPLLIGAYLFLRYNSIINSPIGTSSEKQRFEIETGNSGDTVLEKLASEGIIKENTISYLKIYLRVNKVPALQEGIFSIPGDLTPKELFETLQDPENPHIWVTIPEGLRKDEIAAILSTEFAQKENSVFDQVRFLSLTTDQDFISTLGLSVEGLADLEGFLFPDKYQLPEEATDEYVISTLVNNFIKRTGGVYTYEDVIISSMVEREGNSDTDRPIIADIIKRRLQEGWLLQIDATLLYPKMNWKHEITPEDKDSDSPYNTYSNPGLPPTPISNPGLSAINATKNPQPNNYYYYIHADNGKAYYAETYAQHQLNIANHLR